MKRIFLVTLILCLLLSGTALAANRFSFAEKSLTLREGETLAATLLREGSHAEGGELTFSSGNPAIATVDAEGVVSGVSKGRTTLTATLTRDGKRAAQARIQVTVLRPVQKVTLSLKNLLVYDPDDPEILPLLREDTDYRILLLREGATAPLSAAVTPEDASDKSVDFATTDAGIARILNRKTLKGVQAGECDLILTSASDPDARETFHVLVIRPVKKITLTGGKTVDPGVMLRQGDTVIGFAV